MLTVQIESRLHERSGKAITNFALTLPPAQSDLARLRLLGLGLSAVKRRRSTLYRGFAKPGGRLRRRCRIQKTRTLAGLLGERILLAIAGFRGEAGIATWLTRIVLNEAHGRLRRR